MAEQRRIQLEGSKIVNLIRRENGLRYVVSKVIQLPHTAVGSYKSSFNDLPLLS